MLVEFIVNPYKVIKSNLQFEVLLRKWTALNHLTYYRGALMKKTFYAVLIFLFSSVCTFGQEGEMSFLFDDFEDFNDSNSIWGGTWGLLTDAAAATTIQFELGGTETYNNSFAALHVWGMYDGWGAAECYLNIKQEARNLPFDGISFYAKSTGSSPDTIRVRIRERKAESQRDYDYFKYDFIATSEWTNYKIPWDSLSLAGWGNPEIIFTTEDIYCIDFGPARKNKNIDVCVDDINFWKNVQAGDSLVFDDFEDVDSLNNLWGGPWGVLTDGNAASTMTFEVSEFETYNSSAASIHISGQYASYGAGECYLKKDQSIVDLKNFDGISFYVKNASTTPLRVRIRERKAESLRDYDYFKYDFTPTADWMYVKIPWDSLSLVGWGNPEIIFTTEDIYCIDFGPANTNEAIDVYVDNINLWKSTTTQVERIDIPEIPSKYYMSQNYPNPFNPTSVVKFGLKEDGFATIKLFDATGSEVQNILSEELKAGEYTVNINAENLSSGIYFYSLNINGNLITKKMLLLR